MQSYFRVWPSGVSKECSKYSKISPQWPVGTQMIPCPVWTMGSVYLTAPRWLFFPGKLFLLSLVGIHPVPAQTGIEAKTHRDAFAEALPLCSSLLPGPLPCKFQYSQSPWTPICVSSDPAGSLFLPPSGFIPPAPPSGTSQQEVWAWQDFYLRTTVSYCLLYMSEYNCFL